MGAPLLDLGTQLATSETDARNRLIDLPRITSQQRVYVAARVGGLNIAASSKEAGCSSSTGSKWVADEVIQQYIRHYEDEMASHSLPRVRFQVEDAHAMYMKAYHMSATAAEMVRATDSLVKLHKLDAPVVKELPKRGTARQLADVPVAELMRLAGLRLESLAPEPLDGSFERVDE